MRAKRVGWLLIAAMSALLPGVAEAVDPSLDAATRQRVLERIAALVETRYAEPETALRIAADLRQRAGSGAYDAFASPRDLAGRLSEELGAIDRHFGVWWAAPGSEEATGDPMHDPAQAERWIEQARRHNFGFRRVEVLPGNIGYLDLELFHDTSYAGATAVAAMGFVAGADALIIDLRHNGGGEPTMVQLLASYLFEPQPVELTGLWWREGERVDQSWTLPYLPGRRLPKVPVWVLTARRTGSAAEAFAYDLQALGRATIVGQTTAGGANPGQDFDLGDGFRMFVSTGRAINPVTGTNWQTTGVKPDVEAEADDALVTAQLLALEALHAKADDPLHKRELAWAREELDAPRHPHRLAPAEIAAYVGRYGDRRVWLEDGDLVYQRADRAPRRMQPLGDDRFLHPGVEGFRTRFERDTSGTVVRLVDEWAEGHEEANARRPE